MATMKVAHVPKAGGDFEIVEREIPQPASEQVRIRVQACGVCHSDVLTKEEAGRASCTRASWGTKLPG
jgi:D-arabinose 1-dehydrogenase-like Zn-dependent alcohol dehydrogenase